MVRLEKLTKHYRSGFWLRRVVGVSGIDLGVERGEVFGLLGANGAGKSTLFKLMTGLIRPTSGRGSIDGFELQSREARLRIGYLPENPAVYDFLTGRQFLELMGTVLHLERRTLAKRIDELLEELGLSAKANLQVRKFSKGMVQRLALAQVLLGDPPLCILDEPMSGLDPVGRALVRDVIRRLRERRCTILFSSHALADAEALCDRVALMREGRVAEVNTVSAILSHASRGVEIVVARQALDLPPQLASSVESRVAGGELVFSVPGERAELADELLSMLVSRGIRILAVQRHRHSLEDYFVTRMRQGSLDA